MMFGLAIGLFSCQSDADRLNQIEQAFDTDWQTAIPAGPAGLPLPTADGVRQAWELCRATEKKIKEFQPQSLAGAGAAAYQHLQSSLTERRNYLRQLREDPGIYNLGMHLRSAFPAGPETVDDTWQTVDSLLHQSASFFDQAKRILENPEYDPTLQAIAEQEETLSWLENELPGTLRQYPPDNLQIEKLEAGITKARFAVKDYLAYCRSLAFEYQDSLLNR